jgi:hypothetical protein
LLRGGAMTLCADSVEKILSTEAAKNSLTEIDIYITTFVGLVIRFRATYVASALGQPCGPPRPCSENASMARKKFDWPRRPTFQQNLPRADICRGLVDHLAAAASSAGTQNDACCDPVLSK